MQPPRQHRSAGRATTAAVTVTGQAQPRGELRTLRAVLASCAQQGRSLPASGTPLDTQGRHCKAATAGAALYLLPAAEQSSSHTRWSQTSQLLLHNKPWAAATPWPRHLRAGNDSRVSHTQRELTALCYFIRPDLLPGIKLKHAKCIFSIGKKKENK